MSESARERLDRLKKMADERPDQHADSYAMALLEYDASGKLPRSHADALVSLRADRGAQ
ncbi:hypothetical protein [Sulfitobacter sp. R18_1]|uniref:hypothetical protein n=1 Tax=Sulfitobacter sp. R18_1 TaxID=2821104 RepID=UPI001AD98C7C|nr:hypothetical protein [Sulfitobacter sp. R18_1]MBO9427982.1 hypothetical protein [Sulfitobacter sp. R18_1]